MKNTNLAFHRPEFNRSDDSFRLWQDFIRETAKSFDTGLFVVEKKRHSPMKANMPSIQSLKDLPHEVVLVHPDGEDTRTFNHPERVTYLFGSDTGAAGAYPNLRRVGIALPTDYALWSAVAAGIILHSRGA